MKWLLIALSSISVSGFGQSADTVPGNFLTKLYFPFDAGWTFYQADALTTALNVKTAVEYRRQPGNAFLVRLTVGNQFVAYQLPQPGMTNAVAGKLRFTDYYAGLGYRRGKKSVRAFVMANVGLSTYVFPVVEARKGSLAVKEVQQATLLSVLIFCIEYYLDRKLALTLELSRPQLWTKTDFWADHPGGVGLSVGITTPLF